MNFVDLRDAGDPVEAAKLDPAIAAILTGVALLTDVRNSIVEALREVRYERYLSAEALPMPDSHAAAEQTMASFRNFVGSEDA